MFHCWLTERIASKKEKQYSTATSWVRVQVSFALLRSALVCWRGSRNIIKVQRDTKNNHIGIDVIKGAISLSLFIANFTFLNICLLFIIDIKVNSFFYQILCFFSLENILAMYLCIKILLLSTYIKNIEL